MPAESSKLEIIAPVRALALFEGVIVGRSQFIALLVIVALGAGLLVVRYGSSSATASALPAVNTAASDSASSDSTTPQSTSEQEPPTDVEAPPILRPADSFEELDGWLQTDKESLEAFDGQVRIVQFWTFSCHNCTATIPFLQDIYAKHQPNGLEIIGVHTPEFDFEKDPEAVAEAAVELGVTWPIALDTNKKNFRIWQGDRRFWPRTYVVDQVGNIRYDHVGEGKYEELEQTVAYLIENGP